MARCTLKGQALADAYAAMINADWGAGRVCAHHTGRMIELSGSEIPAAPEMRHMYPNGWTLAGKVEPRDARAKLSS